MTAASILMIPCPRDLKDLEERLPMTLRAPFVLDEPPGRPAQGLCFLGGVQKIQDFPPEVGGVAGLEGQTGLLVDDELGRAPPGCCAVRGLVFPALLR